MKKIKYIIVAIITVFASSCSDWLDVQPSDQVSEDTAFSTLFGFRQTLNGVYVELNASDLYGKALTCELLEIMAQQYAVSSEATAYSALADYDYTGATIKDRFSSVWAKSYNLIANVNKILENCEKRRGTVLSEECLFFARPSDMSFCPRCRTPRRRGFISVRLKNIRITKKSL